VQEDDTPVRKHVRVPLSVGIRRSWPALVLSRRVLVPVGLLCHRDHWHVLQDDVLQLAYKRMLLSGGGCLVVLSDQMVSGRVVESLPVRGRSLSDRRCLGAAEHLTELVVRRRSARFVRVGQLELSIVEAGTVVAT